MQAGVGVRLGKGDNSAVSARAIEEREACPVENRALLLGVRTLTEKHTRWPKFHARKPHFIAAKVSTKLRLLNPIVPMAG